MAVDPQEQIRRWIGTVVLGGLALIVLVVIPWELVVRKGQDTYVLGALGVYLTALIAGPIGIRVYRKNNGNGTGG